MKKKYNSIYLIFFIITILLFSLAYQLENAQQIRMIKMITLLLILLCLTSLRGYIGIKNKVKFVTLLISIGIIFLLENESKYIVNHFFHFYYVLLTIEGILCLSFRNSFILSIVALLVSMIKYINWFTIQIEQKNIIEAFFFFLINLLIIISALFAKYYVNETHKKDKLYKELLVVHQQLKDYSMQTQELIKLKERNRIARDLHDTLGHSMTGLIMQLELAYNYFNEENQAKKLIEEAKENARKTLTQIRHVVKALKETEENFDSIDSIVCLIKEFEKQTKIKIRFNIIGDESLLTPEITIVIYRIIQEGLTNAIRHGKANLIDVGLTFTKSQVALNIQDNGVGCKHIIEGSGLKGMKERVNIIKGTIEYPNCKQGFILKVRIPLDNI